MVVTGVGAAAFALGDPFHDEAGDKIVLCIFYGAGEGVDESRVPVGGFDEAFAVVLGLFAFIDVLAPDGHAYGEKCRGYFVEPVTVFRDKFSQIRRIVIHVNGTADNGGIEDVRGKVGLNFFAGKGAGLQAPVTNDLCYTLGYLGRLSFFGPIYNQDMHCLPPGEVGARNGSDLLYPTSL